MGLIYDNPNLAALTLTRLAAEESKYLGGLERRNGTAYLELVAITLARVHFKSMDDLARATGTNAAALLDTAVLLAQRVLLHTSGSQVWVSVEIRAAGFLHG